MKNDILGLQEIIENAWDNRDMLFDKNTMIGVKTVLEELDLGKLRVAEPQEDGSWKVNEWIKKAVILYFPLQKMQLTEVGPFQFHDKIRFEMGI
jgi:2,3,4,5-tetrahydropyridine-2,6-dicarboxylate N-succinyltransferase